MPRTKSIIVRALATAVLAITSLACARTTPKGIPPQHPAVLDDGHTDAPKVDDSDWPKWVRTNYERTEVMIPMRDGVSLMTTIYRPKHRDTPAPMLLNRTPYGVGPYGKDAFREHLGPSRELVRKGYIFVYQDVRGRWMSEGEFVDVRPQRADDKGTDDSTDTYDTVEWLVKNVANNNGKVGMWGVSYPGYYAAVGMIDHHPALVAVSPQAPIADWFFDDFRHHGAFFLPHAFNFYAVFGVPRPQPTSERAPSFAHGTIDGYRFFLDMGSVANADAKHFEGTRKFWTEAVAHSDYDEFWRARDVLPRLRGVAPAVLVVGGWYDAEDLYGPLAIYRTIEQREQGVDNRLVMGPWRHGGWARDEGKRLGCIDFAGDHSQHYRAAIEAPFFDHHLDGGDKPAIAEASVFDTGARQWKDHDVWPPPQAQPLTLWLGDDGKLGEAAPTTGSASDAWISDPAAPVPFTQAVAIGMTPEYMIEDQRFASRRPDVLTYEGAVLEADTTIAGPIAARVFLSSSGADADIVVKLIDVWPDGETMPLPPADQQPAYACPRTSDGKAIAMDGFQQMVRSEVFRARYRKGYERGVPLTRGKPNEIIVPLQDVLHTFRKGHRIMIQIQSTWFPLVDRNPQSWTKNPLLAPESAFVKATHRVHRSKAHASRVELRVLR
jgi:hypothetical protein